MIDNAPRGCFDLQVSLDYRAIVQKIETELSTAFFLFGYGEWDKSAGLVHVDSTFVASSHPSGERKQESVLNYCSFDKDTLDKSFGVGMGGNRRSEGIY